MPVEKTDREWQRELSPEDYRITRQKGTEPAFTGIYWDHHADGVYHCKCCQAELFNSDDKYDSGSGWPSFTRPLDTEAVAEVRDNSHGMIRTEVVCHQCGAHLGHVFEDGPGPHGLRYCINSASLNFDDQDRQQDSNAVSGVDGQDYQRENNSPWLEDK